MTEHQKVVKHLRKFCIEQFKIIEKEHPQLLQFCLFAKGLEYPETVKEFISQFKDEWFIDWFILEVLSYNKFLEPFLVDSFPSEVEGEDEVYLINGKYLCWFVVRHSNPDVLDWRFIKQKKILTTVWI